MYHRVRESKYREEIVTFVWDFRDHINPGDTIDGVTSGILISSGTDDSDIYRMLLGPPIVSDGTVVSQRVRLGIPGAIYTIIININTFQEEVFEDYAYLAILPRLDIFFKFFLETTLYPIELAYESITTSITLLSGKILETVRIGPDAIQSSITLIGGTLFGAPLYYAMTTLSMYNGNEAITSSITLIDGTLHGGPLNYSMYTEAIQSSITLIDGVIFGAPLNYDMTTEGITSEITLIDGTLV